MQLLTIRIDKPSETNFILGQSHFIKTVEDIHEALVGAVPGIRFGLAFCEASGKCLIRWSGTDDALIELAKRVPPADWVQAMNPQPPTDRSTMPTRRQALQSLTSIAFAGGMLPHLVTRPGAGRELNVPSHTQLEAGDLMAVIGDNSAHDQHRAGYNGVWSLRHRAGTRSIFVPAVAGLNLEHIVTGEHLEDTRTFFEPRNAPMTLTRISDAEAELHQPPTPTFHVESWTRFRLVAPHYLDMDFRFRAHRDVFPRGYVSLFWASYMHAPEDKSMYFLGGLEGQGGHWTQLCTQWHNDQSTVRYRDDHFEITFPEDGRDALFKSLSRLRFDQPFFYGHVDDLVWIVMFDRSEGIRLTHSPSGGGTNSERRTTNPAWDFQFLVTEPEVMQEYGFRTRTALRPRCSRDDILAEVSRWNETLRELTD